jgi:hypothetical protein
MMAQLVAGSVGKQRFVKNKGEIGEKNTPNLPSAFTKSFHTSYDYLSPHY